MDIGKEKENHEQVESPGVFTGGGGCGGCDCEPAGSEALYPNQHDVSKWRGVVDGPPHADDASESRARR